MTSKPTVAIIHGFAEGPAISKKLRQQFEAAGYRIVPEAKAATADVIVAHSGGVYLLPGDLSGKAVVLSAPPIGRTHSIPRSLARKIKLDAQAARRNRAMGKWLVKSTWNTWYIATRPRHIARMLGGTRRYPVLPPLDTARRVLIISHKGDSWSGNITKEVITQLDYGFVGHTGIHDHLWDHPQEYLSVIQYMYES